MNNGRAVVLVADDDIGDRMLIKTALRRASSDLIIHLVTDGDEAIAYLMGEGEYANRVRFPYPTFIITDLKMPRLDGFAVLEHIRANPAWAVIPVVVLSASPDADDIRTAYALGASSYQLKTSDFTEFCSKISILYRYWTSCQIPEVDTSGKQVRTSSSGRIGERFPQPSQAAQTRVSQTIHADSSSKPIASVPD